MCVIIDTNKLSAFFGLADPASSALYAWVQGGGSLVFTTHGRYADELRKANFTNTFLEFRRFSRVLSVSARELDAHIAQIEGERQYRSNDVHLLALALASGARVLYTDDRELQSDFTNRAIINNPRGKIYSKKDHAHLLTAYPCKFPMHMK